MALLAKYVTRLLKKNYAVIVCFIEIKNCANNLLIPARYK